eukprot:TRINITY_DN370_c0_g1_i1.p1 TRINITY_DN370_c0_g1~~TRINITY_DN370_c0_g1_i1.p1  ORF type:complete len:358 (-),score=72.63 TRINITY_DN370_c0_g1_i1:710-1783(-)
MTSIACISSCGHVRALEGQSLQRQCLSPHQVPRGTIPGLKLSCASPASRRGLKLRSSTIAFAASKVAGKGKKGPKSQEDEAVTAPAKLISQQTVVVPDEDDNVDERSWIQEKFDDVVLTTEAAMDIVPGPRVGDSSLPWAVAVPLGYLSITFVIAVIRSWQNFNSPSARRRRQVGKNAFLCETVNAFFPDRQQELTPSELKNLAQKCDTEMGPLLRKYIRYALNERPFNPVLVADLLHLKRVSGVSDEETAEVLNEISRRIVKAKGPLVMNTVGMTEKGIKRKAAVQSLFSKLLYLSELEDFVPSSVQDKVKLKEIFGAAEQDVNLIRIESLSELSDLDSLDKSISAAESDAEAEET